jgi:predicted ArsR family transcriptional regulator
MSARILALRLLESNEELRYTDIADKLKMNPKTVRSLLYKMEKDGLVHVCRYARRDSGSNGTPIRWYAIGPETKPARKPKRKSRKASARQYRERVKREKPELLASWRQKEQLARRKTPLFADEMTAALFGYKKVRHYWVKANNDSRMEKQK